MFTRKFFKFGEVADHFSIDKETLRQAVLLGRIRLFTELFADAGEWTADVFDPVDEEGKWVRPTDGATEDCSWRSMMGNPNSYYLKGWFRCDTDTAEYVARKLSCAAVSVRPDNESLNGLQGTFDVVFEPFPDRPPMHIDSFWVLGSDVGKLLDKNEGHIDKPVGNRERATLLTIISALCKEAGIDVTRTSKAADVIENLTTQLGARVAARTVSTHLERIPDAVERRSGEKGDS